MQRYDEQTVAASHAAEGEGCRRRGWQTVPRQPRVLIVEWGAGAEKERRSWRQSLERRESYWQPGATGRWISTIGYPLAATRGTIEGRGGGEAETRQGCCKAGCERWGRIQGP